MDVVDAARVADIDKSVANASVESDSTWFFRHLTDKQKQYAIALIANNGDWEAARDAAGYSPNTNREHIEGGDAMYAYMTAVRAEIDLATASNAVNVHASLKRLALKAENEKDYGNAIRATKLIGDIQGIFVQQESPVHINGDGNIIQIVLPDRSKPAPISEKTRLILERNNIPVPAEVPA